MGINIESVQKGLAGLRKLYKSDYVGVLKPLFETVPKDAKLKYATDTIHQGGKFSEKTGKFLLEKIPKTKINGFNKLNVEFIPPRACEFSMAKIGKQGDENYLQEIISFYDKNDNIINRFIRESKKNDIFIEYSPWTYSSDVKWGFRRAKTRKITRMSVNRNKAKQDIKVYKGFELTKDNAIPFMPLNNKNAKIISEELLLVQDDALKFDLMKDRYVKRLYHRGFRLDKGEIIERDPNEIYIPKPQNKIESTIIKRSYGKSQEIPDHISLKTHSLSNNLGEVNIDKSGADLYLKKEAKDVKLTNFESYNSDEYAAIADNPFAAYMYLRQQTKGKYLERFFAKRKGILALNVKTYVNSNEVAQNAIGHFSPWNCQIHIKSGYNKPSLHAHEIEHLFQHVSSGRALLTEFGNIVGDYTQKKGAKLLGKCPENLMAEGNRYTHGIIHYPHTSANENLRENSSYWLNELEVGARNEEQKWIQYDHLPHTELMNQVNF